MTSFSEQLAHARKIIANYENGAYDDRLGVNPDERTAITAAREGRPITFAEFRQLVEIGEHELAVKAYDNDQLDLDQEN